MNTDNLLTNSELAQLLELPISKVRRNAKEFLPPDPQASRRSGYSRRFDIGEAFKVFIGTHLVSVLGYSFHDAKIIISDIWPWVESVDLLPGKLTQRLGIDKDLDNYEVRILKHAEKHFDYNIYGRARYGIVWKQDARRGICWKEEKTTYCYSIHSQDGHKFEGPDENVPEFLSSKLLRIKSLLNSFLNAIPGQKQKWLNERGLK